jgi:hypothetical protein
MNNSHEIDRSKSEVEREEVDSPEVLELSLEDLRLVWGAGPSRVAPDY